MKGDFTRWTFDPRNQFTRVLMQQGRVQLDADWNEQAAILLHHLRALAEDLIGPFGVPVNLSGTLGDGFRLDRAIKEDGSIASNDFRLHPGRYWVGGLPVENATEWVHGKTPDHLRPKLENGTWLAYLDVWEEHVAHIQEESLREVALGGVDTATRARLVWRVRLDKDGGATCDEIRRNWDKLLGTWQPVNRGKLKAQAQAGKRGEDDPCIVSPESRYTGENQLYRVEIHKGGTASGGATFKWSRENGSVIFPIVSVSKDTVILGHLGRDGRFDLEEGDWIEILDDDTEMRDEVSSLLKVTSVDKDRSRVTLQGTVPARETSRHQYLRRWDQRVPAGALPVTEGGWLELEKGIFVQFEKASGQPHSYRSGDYWLIPARTATGDVEWPGPPNAPVALPPHGVEHRYAPLGVLKVDNGSVTVVADCRPPLRPPAPRP